MPSVSKAQHGAMEAAAHGHSTLGIPKSVGQEFASADKGKSFVDGGPLSSVIFAEQGGSMPMPPTLGVSSAYPPPPGRRVKGPTNYGKKA
jgi:hypothetical protein